MVYEYQEAKFSQLVDTLHSLPSEYSKPKYLDFILQNTPVNALNKEAEALLWHQRLLHCGTHVFKYLHKKVDWVPNLSKFQFDDVFKCPTCIKSKLTKDSPGPNSLQSTVNTPYQGLYIDFAFSGKVSKDSDGNVIEETRKDVEGLNGETAWILISDAFSCMMHGDCRLSKASPIKYLKSFLAQYSPNHKRKWVMMEKENYMAPQKSKFSSSHLDMISM